ncbi:helix-turn-helix domain-containing protein [Streptomyces justiciae]|uniref:Helix-turn-helix domain-containing protein n=1 Tax=Streptomyces justiciae TaxID=2780140 RepID=A0ABU3M2D2_9ACTN|nr:helix-turn-helix domain-containing protein [Streptomyces justiciae]MDT7845657.1 helix-turn-helix domain-containing protein [Streptomyces justiciae]
MPNDGDFGQLLRRLRQDAGLTIESLAENSGVSARGIGNLERGERTVPQRRTVAALADGLRLDAAERVQLLAAARAGRVRRSNGDNPAGPGALPREVDDFTGRDQELARLSEMARQLEAERGSGQQSVIVLSGAPGVGKTTLVLRAARELAHRFPDGQLLVNLQGMDDDPPHWSELMLRILKTLGLPDSELAKAGPQGRPELYRRVLAERRLLLVLDNGRDEAQVRPLLPGSGDGMALVTSRRMLAGLGGVQRMLVGALRPRDSRDLLAGLVGVERAAAEGEALAEVAELCGHLPLALRVAGNWLATRTGWEVRRFADRLAAEEQRLDALAVDDPRLTAAFDLSYRQLTPEAARMFRRLALVEGPDIGTECAATLIGRPVFDAEDILEELVEAGLLVGFGTERYAFHDLLRLYARTRLEADESRSEAANAKAAMHRWLLETTVVAGRWYEPAHGAPSPDWQGNVDLSDSDKARDWLKAEGVNWLGALRAAAAAGDHTTVVEVAEALHWFSDQWIFWGHWPTVFSLAADCAQALSDPLWEATHLNYHAWALVMCESRHRDGLVRSTQALTAAERCGSLEQQAWSHFYRAWALRMLADYEAAIHDNTVAARLFEAVGDIHGALQALSARGAILLRAQRPAEATVAMQRALDALHAAGDDVEPHIRQFTLANLHGLAGDAHAQLGHWDEAITHNGAACKLSRESGNSAMESIHVVRLGLALLAAGRISEARDAFTRCLELGADADPEYANEAREYLAKLQQ